jgi:tRNA A37 methylthiotransferase MiaB
MEKRFFLETLGCAKNQVDSEIMTAVLKKDGWTRTEDPSRSQVILINTCSFIQDAKQESIDTTLSMANTYQGVPVVMTGCMAQRYGLGSQRRTTGSLKVFLATDSPTGSLSIWIPSSVAESAYFSPMSRSSSPALSVIWSLIPARLI